MNTLEGGCLCGEQRYKILAKPISQGICYCKQCRKSGGAEGSPMLVVESHAFECEKKGLHYFETQSNRGTVVKRYFCPKCASPLFSTLSDIQEILTVKASSLDDSKGFYPEYLVWTKSALNCTSFTLGVPRFEESAPFTHIVGRHR